MARLARVVAPGFPHHIIQRGNRDQQTFFSGNDYRTYIDLMATWCESRDVDIWAYCLTPNRADLIAVPRSADGLRRAIGEAHRRYTQHVNTREGWRGHLWQGRFSSYPVDERYVLPVVLAVEVFPVLVGLVDVPTAWPWSSVRAHLRNEDDRLVKVRPLSQKVRDWSAFLRAPIDDEALAVLGRHERTGRPLGDFAFVSKLERDLDRPLRRRKPGPKPKQQAAP